MLRRMVWKFVRRVWKFVRRVWGVGRSPVCDVSPGGGPFRCGLARAPHRPRLTPRAHRLSRHCASRMGTSQARRAPPPLQPPSDSQDAAPGSGGLNPPRTRRVQLVREGGTRRVQLVREGGGGGGERFLSHRGLWASSLLPRSRARARCGLAAFAPAPAAHVLASH